jgi:hypothetical protein
LRICASTSVVLLLLARIAYAHQTSVKYIDVDPELGVTVRCAPGDLTEPLGLPADATPSVDEVLRHKDIGPYVQQWFTFVGCSVSAPIADRDDKFVRVKWKATCPAGHVRADFTKFFALDHKHEAMLRYGGETTIVRASDPQVVLGHHQSLFAWVHTGMDHIYDGIDHILFVISLLLVVMLYRGTKWELRGFVLTVKSTGLVITAFTIAHSISLIAAALGYVSLSSRFVESMIALSIAYTAIEDIAKPDVRWRFVLTFAFGLVHGLGFASTLANLLPPRDVVVPLLCFNVGVELGQLTIVLVVLPILYLVARTCGAQRYRLYVLPVVAGVIAAVGLVMFANRI